MGEKVKINEHVTVYCIICDQQIYRKAFLKWLCQYLSFLIIFFNRFCQVEKFGVTPYCLYRDLLILIQEFNQP